MFEGLLKHGLSISKAYLVDITDPNQRPSVLGYFNAVSSTGFIIGPLIAGYLADLDPTLRLSLLAGACTFVTNLLIVLLLLPPSKKDLSNPNQCGDGRGSTSFFCSLNWRQVYSVLDITKGLNWREMKAMIVIHALGMLSGLFFRYDFPIFMELNFSISNAALGQIISFRSIASVLASAACGFAAKRHPNFFKQALPAFLLVFISYLSLVLASSVEHVLVGLSVLSVSTAYLRVCMLNLMLQRGRGGDEGAILGFKNSLSSLCRMLAPSVVGVAQEYGSRTGGYLSVLLSLMAALGLLIWPHSIHPNKNFEDKLS